MINMDKNMLVILETVSWGKLCSRRSHDSGPSGAWLEQGEGRESCPAGKLCFCFLSCQDLLGSRQRERRGRGQVKGGTVEGPAVTRRGSWGQGGLPGQTPC